MTLVWKEPQGANQFDCFSSTSSQIQRPCLTLPSLLQATEGSIRILVLYIRNLLPLLNLPNTEDARKQGQRFHPTSHYKASKDALQGSRLNTQTRV